MPEHLQVHLLTDNLLEDLGKWEGEFSPTKEPFDICTNAKDDTIVPVWDFVKNLFKQIQNTTEVRTNMRKTSKCVRC
jgi:hypothetical protein